STTRDTARALHEVTTQAQNALSVQPDLAMLFFSPHHAAAAELLAAVQQRLRPRCLLGCSGEAIVGNDQEVEQGPALSLWLGHWPQTIELQPFRLAAAETSDGHFLPDWPDDLFHNHPERAAGLLLADPFGFPIDDLLKHANEAYPGLRIMGGMASGGRG